MMPIFLMGIYFIVLRLHQLQLYYLLQKEANIYTQAS